MTVPRGLAEPVAFAAGHPRVVDLRESEPSGGIPSAVRNLGWPLASSAFVHFLDDDDVVPDGHYAHALAAFPARPTLDWYSAALNRSAKAQSISSNASAAILQTERARLPSADALARGGVLRAHVVR